MSTTPTSPTLFASSASRSSALIGTSVHVRECLDHEMWSRSRYSSTEPFVAPPRRLDMAPPGYGSRLVLVTVGHRTGQRRISGCALVRPPGQNGRMDLGLRDRVYLVTGGSRGLGFAAAQALVADGARVLLSAPHETTASSAAARLAPDAAADVAAWVVADNADPATPGRLIAAARDRFGRLDGALISVGGSPPGTVAATTDEAWRSAFESVFLGAVRLARALAADLGGSGDGGAVGGFLTGAGG